MSLAADRYLVTTRKNGKARTQVWESHEPLPVAGLQWILEPGDEGVRLRYLGGRDGQIENDASLLVSREEAGRGRKIELPENGIVIELRRLRPLPPAYAAVSQPEDKSDSGLPLVLAFEGIGRSTTGYQRIHSAFVAYSRSKPVFTLINGAEGLRIKPLLEGVRLKRRGQAGQKLQEGDTLKLGMEELREVTVVWGAHWWKFNQVPASVQEAAEKFATLHTSRARTDDETIQRRIAIAMSAALAALMLTLTLWPKAPVAPTEAPEAPVVKFVVQKTEPKIATPAPIVEKPKPVAAAPAPAPAPVVEKKQKAPVPPPAPKKVVKVEPVKAAPPPKAPVPAAPKPDPRAQALAASQARLKALREALGGAKSLAQAPTPQGNAGGGGVATGGLEGGSLKVGQTQVKAGYSGSQTGVATVGGTAGGVGYASGDRAAVNTGGGGFIAMDSGGATVQEGLSRDEVGKVIHAHLDEIRYCHETAMLYKPNLEGRVAVEFSINGQGRVVSAQVQSTTVDERSLPQCILSKLKTWQFPRPKGGVTVKVSYPFNFKAIARDG
jgi:TonB family protein